MKKLAPFILPPLLALGLLSGHTAPAGAGAADDASAVGEVVEAMYDCLTIQEGRTFDFARYKALFIPEARFVRANKDGTVSRFTLEEFLASLRDRIANGQLKTLRETEIAGKTQVFGRMAQVFSSYTKLINTDDPKAAARGINAVQLVKEGDAWKICASLWMDEYGGFTIPNEYLKRRK